MTPITNFLPDSLIATYLFANTPSYLFRHFRLNPYIRELADNMTPQEIVRHFNSIVMKKPRSLNETTLAYALIVSLTLFDYFIAFNALAQIDLSILDWSKEIRDIFLKTAKPTKIEHITPTFPLDQQFIRISSQSINTTSIVPSIPPPQDKGEKSD